MRVDLDGFLGVVWLKMRWPKTLAENCARIICARQDRSALFALSEFEGADGEVRGMRVNEGGILCGPVLLVACSSCEWNVYLPT